MTILNVAFPFAPVTPDTAGGAEQVLSQLDAALVEAGETSLVLACAGSNLRGRHFAVETSTGPLTAEVRQSVQERYREALRDLLLTREVDLVHLHGVDFYSYLPDTSIPTLVTLHLPLAWYPAEAFQRSAGPVYFLCVSQSQRLAGPPIPNYLGEITNGVAIETQRARTRRRDMVCALGRICPEKGFHLALDAAREAGTPMLLAGRVFPYPEHQKYFEEEIRPRLGPRHRFYGSVGGHAKQRMLSASRCLLVPSLVPETSSLVAMEALACGTPVVAFPVGALPEILEDGITGYLVQNEREMARAIRSVDGLKREDCRRAASERFDLKTTTRRYLELYQNLISRHSHARRRTTII